MNRIKKTQQRHNQTKNELIELKVRNIQICRILLIVCRFEEENFEENVVEEVIDPFWP